MAIALRGTPQSGINGAGNSVSVSVPAGVVNGDLLMAAISGFGSVGATPSAPTTPSGWTKIGEASTSGSNGNINTGWYYRIASSEPANYTLANSGGDTYIDADIIAFSGVDATTPFNLTGLSATGKTGTASSAALGSTTRDGCWQVVHLCAYDALSGGTPSGFVGDLGYDGVPNDTILCHQVIATAGPTSTASTAVGAGSDAWAVWAAAIQPPAAAAATSLLPPASAVRHANLRR